MELARFDAGKIEHFINQIEQMVSRSRNMLNQRAIGRIELFFQHLTETKNRIERGAQLMAHVRKKLAFGAIGGFGGIARGNQLGLSRLEFADVMKTEHPANGSLLITLRQTDNFKNPAIHHPTFDLPFTLRISEQLVDPAPHTQGVFQHREYPIKQGASIRARTH